MKSLRLGLFGVLLAGCAAVDDAPPVSEQMATVAPEESGPNAAAVKALAQLWVDAEYATGLEIGLLHDGRIETYGFGRRDETTSARPDADTIFEVGSISKLFTGLLLADAATRGEVTLDQPAQELVGPETEVPTRDGEAITLRHLSTHASGLPRMSPVPAGADPLNPYVDPWAPYSSAEMIADLPRMTLRTKPGEVYAYSNYGVGLLGELLSVRAGQSYRELLAARVTKPLGLRRTDIEYPTGDANIAQPHAGDGKPVPAEDLQAYAPAGKVRTTAKDLLRFAQAFLTPPAGAEGDALRLAKTVQAEPIVDPASGARQKMGLGWHISGDGTVLSHGGATIGSNASLQTDLVRGDAVVVLANNGSAQPDLLGSLLRAVLRGETPRPPPFARVVPVAAETLRSYEGVYELSPTFAITITNEDGRTYAQATDQPRFRIYPTSTTRFVFHVVSAAVSFQSDEHGRVVSLTLHQNGDHVGVKRP